jgi:peptide/nickel transport system ATP-binding protein
VESGSADAVVEQPRHPYTRLLLESAPDPERDGGLLDEPEVVDDEETLGEPPSLVDPPAGCRFHPRCPLAKPVCATAFPPRTHFDDGQWVHCWSYDEENYR